MSAMTLPAGTWDTHVHVFDPDRFPYAVSRSYTPGPAKLENLRDRHRQWGVSHVVLVQPSVYGTDNACMLDTLKTLGVTARGVAVIDPNTIPDEALADMQAAGVSGIRVNLVASGTQAGANPFRRLAERLCGSGLFLQVYAPMADILTNASMIETAGVPVVLDHFAGARATGRTEDQQTLESFCRNAPVWIKLSADYRIAHDLITFEARALDLIGLFWSLMPDRLIWGSDWPHTGGGAARQTRPVDEIEAFRTVYALSIPHLLADAGLDESARTRVLAGNPSTLFSRTPWTRTDRHGAPSAVVSGTGPQ